MRALATVVWGLALVVADIRFDDIDVLPDPLGWALAVAALGSLARLHPAYGVAAGASSIGVVVSLPDWFRPAGTIGEVLVAIVTTVVVLGTCTGIMATVPEQAATARLIRAWELGLSLALLVLLGFASIEPATGVLVLVVGLVELGVFIWFLVLLVRASRCPEPVAPTELTGAGS